MSRAGTLLTTTRPVEYSTIPEANFPSGAILTKSGFVVRERGPAGSVGFAITWPEGKATRVAVWLAPAFPGAGMREIRTRSGATNVKWQPDSFFNSPFNGNGAAPRTSHATTDPDTW